MSDWRSLGDTTLDAWKRVLVAADSPLADVASEAFRAASPHTKLALGMLRVESQFFTAFRLNIKSNNNPFNLKSPTTGEFVRYATPVEGIRAWRDRITSNTYKGGVYADTTTLESLVHVFAPADDNNDEQDYVSLILQTILPLEGVPEAVKPTVILTPGHRNTSGGNAEETKLTPALAHAYFLAFSNAGYHTINLGDTNGGLDLASQRIANAIATAPGECVALDLHYEGSPAPGVFTIVPDVTGLVTNAPVNQDPLDTWANNVRDRELAVAISEGIRAKTGLPLRTGIRVPGVMDEGETGVGADGFRLATFAYTSPYRAKATRLVVEHGCHIHPDDRAIIFAEGFEDKCAAAAVEAVDVVYKVEDKYVSPSPFDVKRGDAGLKKINGTQVYMVTASVRAQKRTACRAWADAAAPQSSPSIPAGSWVVVIASFRLKSGEQWYVTEDYDRVRASSFVQRLPVG